MSTYSLILIAFIAWGLGIAGGLLFFAMAVVAKRYDEAREEAEARVKREHLAAARQQAEEFLAEVTDEQAMSFSRLQAEAYERDVARLAALN